MNVLVLPGINPRTERWATGLLNELAMPDWSTTVQRYNHWDCDGGEQCLDFPGEVERLAGVQAELLIAKSLGVMIGLAAAGRKLLAPARAILIGTPVTALRENNMDPGALVQGTGIPLLFIQQKNDIVGSAEQLRAAVGDLPRVQLVEIPGDNHQYKDLKLLARHIRKFV